MTSPATRQRNHRDVMEPGLDIIKSEPRPNLGQFLPINSAGAMLNCRWRVAVGPAITGLFRQRGAGPNLANSRVFELSLPNIAASADGISQREATGRSAAKITGTINQSLTKTADL